MWIGPYPIHSALDFSRARQSTPSATSDSNIARTFVKSTHTTAGSVQCSAVTRPSQFPFHQSATIDKKESNKFDLSNKACPPGER